MALRHFAPADNANFYELWLQTNPLFTGLSLTNLGIAPFNGSFDHKLVPTMTYLLGIGKTLYMNQRFVAYDVYTYALGELLAPKISSTLVSDRDTSRRNIVNWVTSLITAANLANYTSATRDNYINHITNHPNDRERLYNGSEEADWPDTNIIPSPEAAVRILYFVASAASRVCMKNGLTMLTHCYVSVLKRGTVSEQFLEKIVNGVKADLNTDITLMQEVIPSFYRMYGQWITAANIREITAHWEALLPQQALRLVLTVRQASGGGLTSFITIGRAMRKYPRFEWNRIEAYFPTDWIAFQTAVTTVNGNVWYGFNKDLAAVRSTLYKSLAYVAKELLVKVNGEIALNRYAGWVRRVAHQAAIDRLIADFEELMSLPPREEDMQNHIKIAAPLIELVGDDQHADIFA